MVSLFLYFHLPLSSESSAKANGVCSHYFPGPDIYSFGARFRCRVQLPDRAIRHLQHNGFPFRPGGAVFYDFPENVLGTHWQIIVGI